MLEKIIGGSFLLVLIYLVLQSRNASEVISGIGGTGAGFLGTLQGRSVTFPGGVQVSGGIS